MVETEQKSKNNIENLDYKLGVAKRYGVGIYYGLFNAIKKFPSCKQFYLIQDIQSEQFLEDTMKLKEYYTDNCLDSILFYNRKIALEMSGYAKDNTRVRTLRKNKDNWEIVPLKENELKSGGIEMKNDTKIEFPIKISDYVSLYNKTTRTKNRIMNIAGQMQMMGHEFKRNKFGTRFINEKDINIIEEILKKTTIDNPISKATKEVMTKLKDENFQEQLSINNIDLNTKEKIEFPITLKDYAYFYNKNDKEKKKAKNIIDEMQRQGYKLKKGSRNARFMTENDVEILEKIIQKTNKGYTRTQSVELVINELNEQENVQEQLSTNQISLDIQESIKQYMDSKFSEIQQDITGLSYNMNKNINKINSKNELIEKVQELKDEIYTLTQENRTLKEEVSRLNFMNYKKFK